MAINSFGSGMPLMQAPTSPFNGNSSNANLLTAGLGMAASATQLLGTLLGNQFNAASQFQGLPLQNNAASGNPGMNRFGGLMQAVAGLLQAMLPMLQMMSGSLGANPQASQLAGQLGGGTGLLPPLGGQPLPFNAAVMPPAYGSPYGNPYGGAPAGTQFPQQGVGTGSQALNWALGNSGRNGGSMNATDLDNNMRLYNIFNTGRGGY